MIKCNILSITFLKHENDCDITHEKYVCKWTLEIKYISECWKILTLLSRKHKRLLQFTLLKNSYYVMTCFDFLNNIFVYKFCDPSTLYWGSHYHKCNSEVSHFLLAKFSACQQLFYMKNSFSNCPYQVDPID